MEIPNQQRDRDLIVTAPPQIQQKLQHLMGLMEVLGIRVVYVYNTEKEVVRFLEDNPTIEAFIMEQRQWEMQQLIDLICNSYDYSHRYNGCEHNQEIERIVVSNPLLMAVVLKKKMADPTWPKGLKKWHKSVTRSQRNHLVQLLMSAARSPCRLGRECEPRMCHLDHLDVLGMGDTEDRIFEAADTLAEYYQLAAASMLEMEMNLESSLRLEPLGILYF